MPRYAVHMTRTVVEFVTDYVTADTEEEARAVALAGADALDWSTDYGNFSDPEIESVDIRED